MEKLKIMIVGYGRMGHQIEAAALAAGHEVVSIVDPVVEEEGIMRKALGIEALSDSPDVAIDFSAPSSAPDNILFYARQGLPAVVGTTGWGGEMERLSEVVSGIPGAKILHSGNFSLGVAATLRIAEYAAKVFDRLEGYDVSIHEVHHKMKADSPSGTALMLAEKVLGNVGRLESVETETLHSAKGEGVLHVTSERVGKVPGTHTLTFDSDADTITIEHRARNREGFASGAVAAASWLVAAKEEGLIPFEAFLDDFLGGI